MKTNISEKAKTSEKNLTLKKVKKFLQNTVWVYGGYIFTQDKERFRRVASQIDSGMIQANNTSYVTPSSPFGGYKVSGLGREHGKFGFYELSQIKLIAEDK